MYCERCGAKNEDDARFCGECGAPLNEPQPHYQQGPGWQPQPERKTHFKPEPMVRPQPGKKTSRPLIAAAAVLGVLILVLAAVLIKTSLDSSSREDEELDTLLEQADAREEDAKEDGEEKKEQTDKAKEEEKPQVTAQATATPTATPVPTQAPTETPAPTQAPTATPASTQAPAVEYVAVKYGLQAPATDFMFPYSSERLLTQAELDSMADASVEVMHSRSQLAINEILARYGYSFDPNKSDTARDIYNRVAGKDWYQQAQQQCGYSNANSLIADMNSVEKDNIDLINEWQKQHGCYY